MLGVGLDWAEQFHDVALGVPEKGVIEEFRIGHGPAGIARLVARCLALQPDPDEVRVVLETRHGLLVEALEVLWHCLRLGATYDEATHTANRRSAASDRAGTARRAA